MSDDRLEALLSAELDDALDDAERRELDNRMQDPAARALRDEYAEIDRQLLESADLAPPPQLREQILERVQLPPARQSAATTDRSSGWLRYGLAAAAGVLLTLSIQQVASLDTQLQTRTDQLVGTAAPGGDVIDRLQLDAEATTASAVLLRRGALLMLKLDIDTPAPASVRIELPDGLSVDSFANIERPLTHLELRAGIMEFAAVGRHRIDVLLDGIPTQNSDISLALTSEGQLLAEGILDAAR